MLSVFAIGILFSTSGCKDENITNIFNIDSSRVFIDSSTINIDSSRIFNTIGQTNYTATFVLDLDGDGMAHYPYGPDMDDDGDGLISRFFGGNDVNDQDASIGSTGMGNGLFSNAVFYWGTEDDPEYTGFGDFNKDGWQDPFLLESSFNAVGVHTNMGNGFFNVPLHYGVESSYDDYFPALGDFDNDGNLDIALAGSGSGVRVLRGLGTGYFGGFTDYDVFGTDFISHVVSADFNKDGSLDIAALDSDNYRIVVAYNDGTGSFTNADTLTMTADDIGALQMGDLNNDGNLDLICVKSNSGNDSLAVFLGDGTGDFGTEINTILTEVSVCNCHSMALGDIDGDGNLDMVTRSNQSSSVLFAFGNGDGTFTGELSVGTFTSSYEPYHFYIVPDINGDGNVDIVATENNDEQIGVFLGSGNRTNFTIGVINIGYDVEVMGAAVTDFNGDGIYDIAIYSDESSEPQAGLYVLYGQGN